MDERKRIEKLGKICGIRKELVAFWKLIWNILWNCMIFTMIFLWLPERLTLGKVEKLTQNLRDKEKMVLHGKNLQLYLSLGMKLKLVRRGLKFQEKNFMKNYIDKNTSLRSQAKNAFEKDLFKLMNNSVFGKTMENVRNRETIELVKDAERAAKLVNKPNFEELKIFDEF